VFELSVESVEFGLNALLLCVRWQTSLWLTP